MTSSPLIPMAAVTMIPVLMLAMPADAADAATTNPAIAALDKFITTQTETGAIKRDQPEWKARLPKPPKVDFTEKTEYHWVIVTNKGEIRVRLMPQVAPMHVASTIYLTRLGFYDGLAFHRVIKGFMAQGGCPLGRGTGGPGYQYDGEFDPQVKHDRPFLLSMANRGPGTDGSQFFLTFVPTPWLDGKHTIFGEAVAGQDVIKQLEAAGSQSGQTSEPLSIVKATIETRPAD